MNYNSLIKRKKILVTGGAGFVGSHLVRRLYNNGNTVYVLDNYFTGNTKNHCKGVIYKKAETQDIFKLYKKIPLDYIYHLGEYPRVEQSYEDFDLVMRYNNYPFYQVLRLAKLHDAKLIYSGSSTKFSKNIDKVESPYSFSKRINTKLLVKYAQWFKLKYAITYFYNVYGPGEISEGKYATVIAFFLNLKRKNAKYLPVTKPGNQKRRFTHIEDIVNGLIIVGKRGFGDDYGIASNKEYTILDLVKLFNMKPRLMPEKKGNRLGALLKTAKTKNLGWKSLYKLKDYLNDEFSK